MSTFAVQCPKCGIELDAQKKYLGFWVSCESCGHEFTLWAPEDSLEQYQNVLEEFKPSIVAKAGLPKSFQSPLFTKGLCDLLLTKEGTKSIFHFSYPLLRPQEQGTRIQGETRYWKDPVNVLGKPYLICKEWHDYNRKTLVFWLRQMNVHYDDLLCACKGITDTHSVQNDIEVQPVSKKQVDSPRNSINSTGANSTINENLFTFSFEDPRFVFSYTKPTELVIKSERIPLKAWSDLVREIASYIYRHQPDIIEHFIDVKDSRFSVIRRRIGFSRDKGKLTHGKEISKDLWVEVNFSSNDCVCFAVDLASLANLEKDKIVVSYLITQKQPNREVSSESCKTERHDNVLSKQNNVPQVIENIPNVNSKMHKESNQTDGWFGEKIKPLDVAIWVKCLQLPQVFPKWGIDLLGRWMEMGGTATCTEYAKRYGTSPAAPIQPICNLGMRISQITECKVPTGKDGKTAWFSVMFLGRYSIEKGQNEWRVRPELAEAWNQLFGNKTLPVETDIAETEARPNNKVDSEFSQIDPFSLTSAVIQEMLHRKLLISGGPVEELKTFQWCHSVLNLRYPLVRTLKLYESVHDFKETFSLIPGYDNTMMLICKDQTGLNRKNFLAWAHKNGFSLSDVAKLLGVELAETETDSPQKLEEGVLQEETSEPEEEEECTSVSDDLLLKTVLTLMYQKKLLTNSLLGRIQTMYFCLSTFGTTKPVIQRLYPSMRPSDYSAQYKPWLSTEDGIHYLILKKCDALKQKSLLQWAKSLHLDLEELRKELHCTREALGLSLPSQPVAPLQSVIPATEKPLPPSSTTEKVAVSTNELHEQYSRLHQEAPKPIDEVIRNIVKSNYGILEQAVISKGTEQGFDSDRLALRLRKHSDVLTIAGHCYVKDSIADLDDAAEILLKALQELFNRNGGYTSAHELFKSVQAQLDDFFYDNGAFESESEVYQLASYLFEQTGYKNHHFIFRQGIHIWEQEPDYPMGDQGLLILWARENQGVLTTSCAHENFKRRGVNDNSLSSTFALSMNKVFEQFWMVKDGIYLLKEKIHLTSDFLQDVKTQIKLLMAAFEFGFIPMWDIASDWYAGLPPLISGQPWTPMLLQSVIRDYGNELGVRTIPRQEVRQLHAAIVEKQSEIQDYSDLIYLSVRNHTQAKSVTIDRNTLFDWLISDGLWPLEMTPSYGQTFLNLFKGNIHFHPIDKNNVMVV